MPRPNDASQLAFHQELGSWEGTMAHDIVEGTMRIHIHNTGNTTCTVTFDNRITHEVERVAIDPGEDLRREYVCRRTAYDPKMIQITNATQRDERNQQDPRIEVWCWGPPGTLIYPGKAG